ncbi:hypothetical protein KQI82_10305 [Oscillibacter sp. MSJ-2]|uniref:Uncharacterized protein n=1 Tax=Dysosmobacter acutus TaxID=2841504 RepID=A0ABS6FAH8_9FIRM|nr:hypothetical protein [Dysosmobacter acutus]MBU5627299.1 hypothetical protein [Dysosmobacter acutus]
MYRLAERTDDRGVDHTVTMEGFPWNEAMYLWILNMLSEEAGLRQRKEGGK